MSYDRTQFPSAAFDRWLTTPPKDRNPVNECDNCDGEGCEFCPADEPEYEPDEYFPEESEEYYRDEDFYHYYGDE